MTELIWILVVGGAVWMAVDFVQRKGAAEEARDREEYNRLAAARYEAQRLHSLEQRKELGRQARELAAEMDMCTCTLDMSAWCAQHNAREAEGR